MTIHDLINHARRLSETGTSSDIFALSVCLAHTRTYRDCFFSMFEIIDGMITQGLII